MSLAWLETEVPVLLVVCSLLQVLGVAADFKVHLDSDGPAVLDAAITFSGSLSGISDPSGMYKWRWYDTASPGHYKEEEVNGSISQISYVITYPSSEYDSGIYEMVLTIYEFDYFFWRDIGKANTKFRITRELNGRLDVEQDPATGIEGGIINSELETKISVDFHDPSGFLDDATIKYFWFINTVNYGQTTKGEFLRNFTEPGEYDVEVTAIADFKNSSYPSEPGGSGVILGNESSRSHVRSHAENFNKARPSRGVKMAIFQRKLVSKEPISNINYTGKTMLKHGELVDLLITCNGSKNWNFCWSMKEKGYNITGNETCETPPTELSYRCETNIIWYLKQSDTYNILVILANDVSRKIQVIPVTVYDVAREAPVGIVIIPVASGIVVVILIITGVALHAHYRNRLAVEVADFDFGQADEEELQYKSFWERLRESFGAYFTSGSDLQSEGSSVSGRRSVQMPGPVGIGYGSIT